MGPWKQSKVTIECGHNGKLIFVDIIEVKIYVLHFKHCTIKYSRKFRRTRNHIHIAHSVFEQSSEHAVIVDQSGVDCVVSFCTFLGNSGAILSKYNSLEISYTTLCNNYNNALNIQHVDLKLQYSMFMNNSSPASGCAIYAHESSLAIAQTQFLENVALGDGGSIYTTKCNVSTFYSRFVNNSNSAILSIGIQPVPSVFLANCI